MQSKNVSVRPFRQKFLATALLATAVAALTVLSGCGLFNSSKGSSGINPPAGAYSNVIFIGDSLTAGFQNGSLLDTQQPNGYPA